MNLGRLIRDGSRPSRRRIAKIIFNFPEQEEWDHRTAQRYEIEHARQTIVGHFQQAYSTWQERPADFLSLKKDDEWFNGNAALYAEFSNGVAARTCLEIGSGPFGHLAPCRAFKKRIIIDPLAESYRDIQRELFGKTFFTDDIVLYPTSAETVIDRLLGQVDGLIVCRNALDHCEDPLAVLQNIADYAAPGCWLFLWTDIWHVAGTDAGHHNITRSHKMMTSLIHGLGFDILQMGRAIRDPAEYLEFGCIARKQ
jgi:SAM-dependent methyltransferase